MIANKVVFVLGAGASAGYGLPSGRELKRLCLTGDGGLEKLLDQLAIRGVSVQDLQRRLRKSPVRSIDAFLEQQSKEDIRLGKLMIANWIARQENEAKLFEPEPTQGERAEYWYEQLFEWMRGKTLTAFGENACRFVTFNYDRSLERFLLSSLKATYPAASGDHAKALSRIPIVHVHGDLGPLAGEENSFFHKYGTAVRTGQDLLRMAERIRIVHESHDMQGFAKAAELLADADWIMFLGFGYHLENIERLNLNKASASARIVGSCQGFTQSEVVHLINPLFARTGRSLEELFTEAMSRGPCPLGDYLRNNVNCFTVRR